MSFASTCALGHAAQRHYAGGRTLSAQRLKNPYAGMTCEAQYLPAIQERARTLDMAKVLQMVVKGA